MMSKMFQSEELMGIYPLMVLMVFDVERLVVAFPLVKFLQ